MKKICTDIEVFINIFCKNRCYHTIFQGNRQDTKRKGGGIMPPSKLLLAERLAISALINSRILFMSAHQNPIQRAVVLRVTVISALLNGAFDTLICLVVHDIILL